MTVAGSIERSTSAKCSAGPKSDLQGRSGLARAEEVEKFVMVGPGPALGQKVLGSQGHQGFKFFFIFIFYYFFF